MLISIGGYWRALDKRDHAFAWRRLSRTPTARVVVQLNYALCPAVGIARTSCQQLQQALAWVWRHAAEHGGERDRIVVAGHSAGGHLAAMLLACDWPALAPELPADLVKSALAISGLYELEPLQHAPFLAADLGLSAAQARRLSPALWPAPANGRLATVVGGDESEEFRRQAALISSAWGAAVVAAETIAGRNHMDVLHEIADPGSRTHALALELLGIP